MSLRKVTFFDRNGAALMDVDEDWQAKPVVFGQRWVNQDTLETIRVRGGERTDRYGQPIEAISPTTSTSPFFAGGPSNLDKKSEGRNGNRGPQRQALR
jgi:hypothetical protein